MSGSEGQTLGSVNDYVPSMPYSDKKHFEPPRVYVPPPNLDYQHGRPSFLAESLPYGLASNVFGTPQFLGSVTKLHKLQMQHSMLTWKYEMRRAAQYILPFLLLGPSGAARDASFVSEAGISLMIAVRSASAVQRNPTFLDPTTFPSGKAVQSHTFDLDSPFDFIQNVRNTIKIINDHLEASCSRSPIKAISDIRGSVFVFCETGNDRSAVFVAAYLMAVFGIDVFNAIQVVQSQRFCITVPDNMKNMLLDLQDILVAERQVASSNYVSAESYSQIHRLSATQLHRQGKRTIDDAYQSDEDMNENVEMEHAITTREGIAPFSDVEG